MNQTSGSMKYSFMYQRVLGVPVSSLATGLKTWTSTTQGAAVRYATYIHKCQFLAYLPDKKTDCAVCQLLNDGTCGTLKALYTQQIQGVAPLAATPP